MNKWGLFLLEFLLGLCLMFYGIIAFDGKEYGGLPFFLIGLFVLFFSLVSGIIYSIKNETRNPAVMGVLLLLIILVSIYFIWAIFF